MDNNIFERLKKYETHLRRGFYGGYCYGLYQRDFDELNEFYKVLGGRENLKYSCQACTLRLVKFVGKIYFEEVERRKAEQEKPPVEQPVEHMVEPPVEKPKKTRARKTKKED